MPEVVLRNPTLPSQPIVVTVADDLIVPVAYKLSGWEIDTQTAPDDARNEAPPPPRGGKKRVPRFDDEPPAEPGSTTEPADAPATTEGN